MFRIFQFNLFTLCDVGPRVFYGNVLISYSVLKSSKQATPFWKYVFDCRRIQPMFNS